MKLNHILALVLTVGLSVSSAHAYEDLTNEWRNSVGANANITQNNLNTTPAPQVKKSKWRTSVDVRNNVPNVRIERASKNADGKISKVNFIKSSTRLGANYKGAFDVGVKGTRNGFKIDLGKGW